MHVNKTFSLNVADIATFAINKKKIIQNQK